MSGSLLHDLLIVFSVVAGLAVIVAVGHALVYKRDPRSAIAWVGVILLVPWLGPLLYLLLGINRIRRKAAAVRGGLEKHEAPSSATALAEESLREHVAAEARHLAALSNIVGQVTGKPLLPGNWIVPYANGDEAFPAMLWAIRHAQRSVTLSTYVFSHDRAGERFVEALTEAAERGVDVRVIVDDIGAGRLGPSALPELRQAGLKVAVFLPILIPRRLVFINLRNHRKILVVDGRIGFTGGMNLHEGNLLHLHPRRPVEDLHFRVEGPATAHLQEAFADDWKFCTGESLEGEKWYPRLLSAGSSAARGIIDGPDEHLDALHWIILGALACARSNVRIITPYFLPDQTIVTSLNLAAMRGVEVDLLIPEESNHPVVSWATDAMLWQLLEHGCRIWKTPPPFDHTKLMLADGNWALLGSSNWDARSLRLNFEFNLECYDAALVSRLEASVRAKLEQARAVTLKEVNSRSLPVRIRDGTARLLTPYL